MFGTCSAGRTSTKSAEAHPSQPSVLLGLVLRPISKLRPRQSHLQMLLSIGVNKLGQGPYPLVLIVPGRAG